MTVVTRIAPSPTGFLHIGGARTALFNWLFARHHGGTFRLRIEDTDRARSTPEAIDAILDGLSWLGIDWDGDVVYQSRNRERHRELALALLEAGKGYRCYATPEELAEMREKARAEGRTRLYDGRWRERNPAEAPPGIDPVVRIKMPSGGETVIDDDVQGIVRVANDRLDDFVLLRADGTPTYMLAAVADDHDMGITHIIRGDDHLNNAVRQYHLYRALGWEAPRFAHISLIHGPDGARLQKRHGALGIGAYRDMGYLPEAMRNYLARLGWSHGDDEIFTTDQAIRWFGLDAVGRSPARFDLARLDSLNGHYIRAADDRRLVDQILPRIEDMLGRSPDAAMVERLIKGMYSLKQRAKTLEELAEKSMIYCRSAPLPISEKAARLLDSEGLGHLGGLEPRLRALERWGEPELEAAIREYCETAGVKLGNVAQPLRAALTGSTVSPGVFEVMEVLGREEVLARVSAVTG